jgi:hypothetical protein
MWTRLKAFLTTRRISTEEYTKLRAVGTAVREWLETMEEPQAKELPMLEPMLLNRIRIAHETGELQDMWEGIGSLVSQPSGERVGPLVLASPARKSRGLHSLSRRRLEELRQQGVMPRKDDPQVKQQWMGGGPPPPPKPEDWPGGPDLKSSNFCKANEEPPPPDRDTGIQDAHASKPSDGTYPDDYRGNEDRPDRPDEIGRR